jgi:hypothetical protein
MQLWATLLAVAIVILHIIKVIKDNVKKDVFFGLHCNGNMFQNSIIAVTEHRCSKKNVIWAFASNNKQTGL